MGYRVKYLVFLSAFLLGAFSIITWKSFRVYSESYTQSSVAKEMDVLEQRVQSIASEFERFKTIVKTGNSVEEQLKVFHVPLMAHVIFIDGKWKAKWFEGVKGMREQAKSLAHQISFESAPQARNSWFSVKFQDQSTGYAFVMPAIADSSVHFYTFFLNEKSIAQVLKQSSIVDSFHVISPTTGEIYSSEKKDLKQIEAQLSSVAKKNHGLLVLDAKREKMALYHFHPFLQSYVFKVIPQIKIASIPLSRFYGLMVLAVVLCGIAVFAMHLLLETLFSRIGSAVQTLEAATGKTVFKDAGDEVTPLENLAMALASTEFARTGPQQAAQEVAESKVATPQEMSTDERSELRSRAINCLGYLNRLKIQFQIDSPHMRLLEEELRGLRKSLDTASGVVDTAFTTQPSFNPILSSYQKDFVGAKSQSVETTKISDILKVTGADKEVAAPAVRRPKREINGLGDL